MDEQHPDLVAIDRMVSDRFDRVLRAEQEAAAVTRRRTASLRDLLIELEELDVDVVIHLEGAAPRGRVHSVGSDNLRLVTLEGTTLIVSLAAVAWVSTT